MPDLSKGRSSTAVKPRRSARRGSFIWPILFSVALIIGGIEALALGLVRQQDAAHLAAAPVCAAGQQTGCRLDELVTVVDLSTSSGRSGTTHLVKVQTPDGNTQIVYAGDHDAGLLSQLQVSEALNAELWNGNVIRLADDAGHSLLADDSPVVTGPLFLIIGPLAIIAGGLLLAFCVRRLLRERSANR